MLLVQPLIIVQSPSVTSLEMVEMEVANTLPRIALPSLMVALTSTATKQPVIALFPTELAVLLLIVLGVSGLNGQLAPSHVVTQL
jgi:ABC-type proline/glycine betaine transport system permease subunit